jgi:DNA-directed RNA polymerase beta subunit
MTIPTIMEALFGLYAIETRQFLTTTQFDDILDIRQELKKLNLPSDGTFLMRNPVNGKLMEPIFIGPMHYNLLAHFASHKCYARSKGVNSKLTRQPTDGRSRNGGLRLGEMERDCLIGLNMPHTLLDRLFYSSDEFYIYICGKCKHHALNSDICLCGATSEYISKVKTPFVSNLVFNQMKAMGCDIRFNVDNMMEEDDNIDEEEGNDEDVDEED